MAAEVIVELTSQQGGPGSTGGGGNAGVGAQIIPYPPKARSEHGIGTMGVDVG